MDIPSVQEAPPSETKQLDIIHGDNINNVRRVICSPRFIELARAMPSHEQNSLVGFAIEMLMLGFDEEKFWTMLSHVVGKNSNTKYPDCTALTLSKYSVDFILTQAGVNPDDKSEEAKSRAFEYVIDKIWNKGFFYLPVNMNTAKCVKECGKIPSVIETIEEEDYQRLLAILGSKNLDGVLDNPKRKVELCDSAFRAAEIAIFQPEWFYSFTPAFIRRSHGGAQGNVQSLVADREVDSGKDESIHFSDEERKFIIELFHKYWEKYGESSPALVLVPRWRKLPNIGGTIDFFRTYEQYREYWGKLENPDYDKKTVLDVIRSVYWRFIAESRTNIDDRGMECPEAEIIELPMFRKPINVTQLLANLFAFFTSPADREKKARELSRQAEKTLAEIKN